MLFCSGSGFASGALKMEPWQPPQPTEKDYRRIEKYRAAKQ